MLHKIWLLQLDVSSQRREATFSNVQWLCCNVTLHSSTLSPSSSRSAHPKSLSPNPSLSPRWVLAAVANSLRLNFQRELHEIINQSSWNVMVNENEDENFVVCCTFLTTAAIFIQFIESLRINALLDKAAFCMPGNIFWGFFEGREGQRKVLDEKRPRNIGLIMMLKAKQGYHKS